MAALIEYVCIASHPTRSDPSITLEKRSWAYCSWGASSGHEWTRIDPIGVEALRSPAGTSRPRLVRDEKTEAAGAGR